MTTRVRRAALTGGVVWSLTLFLTTWAHIFWGYGTDFLKIWVSIYPGYTLDPVGSVIGLLYGFLDMVIGIYIIHWVYEKAAHWG